MNRPGKVLPKFITYLPGLHPGIAAGIPGFDCCIPITGVP